MDGLIAVILTLTVLAILPSAIRAGRQLAPWVPSSVPLAREIIASLNAPRASRFCDIGCGDGRIVALAARRFGFDAYGYEISIAPLLLALLRKIWLRSENYHIERRDLYSVDLGTFDIIYVYGLPQTNETRVSKKLQAELKPGTYVISYNFSIPHLRLIREVHDRWGNVFLYQR